MSLSKIQISKLYINSAGLLMCGEPSLISSAVEGVSLNTSERHSATLQEHSIVFTNVVADVCNGYTKECRDKYKMPDSI